MEKTLILYGTKYGSTGEIAEKLARILGPAVAVKVSDFSDQHKNYSSVVIGSPLYRETVLPEVEYFIRDWCKWLKSKKVALFTVSLMPSSPENDVSAFVNLLGDCVVWTGAFGGNMDLSKLNQEDRQSIERFFKVSDVSLSCQDASNDAELAEKALELKRALKNTQTMPQDRLSQFIDDYLRSHNTCTLCTGHGSEVRATPIEYGYFDGSLYFLSEGGEKFAHLLLNPLVSVAVYDPYAGFHDVYGLQITGKAEMIPLGSDEYTRVAGLKGLNAQKLAALPVRLNMFRVVPVKYEFLSSKLGREGYDTKQTLLL